MSFTQTHTHTHTSVKNAFYSNIIRLYGKNVEKKMLLKHAEKYANLNTMLLRFRGIGI